MKPSYAVVFAVAAWNWCAFAAAAADDLWPQNAVVIKSIITAPGGAELRVGERIVGKTRDLLVDVRKVQGDWLWIHTGEGIEGWIRKSEATPLDHGYEYFSARLRQNPSDAEAYHRRAVVLNATAFRSSNSAAQLDQALRDAEQALRLAPREPAYYEGRGNIWLSKDNPDRALADYEQAIRLAPDDAFYYAGAARAWLKKKDADRAISLATEGIRRDPRLPSLYRVRRDAYKEKKEYLNAYFDYRRARKLDQGGQGGAFGLIDMSEGELLLSSAAEADLAAFQPRDVEEFADRAQAWRNKGKYARAIADFEIAIRDKDSDGRLRLGRGECRQRVGRYAEALTDYEAAMRLDPEEWFAFTDAALLLASCPDAAIRNGPRAIELALKAGDLCDWIDSEALAALAAAYAETGDFEKAVETQREALDAAFQNEKEAYQRRLELYQDGKPYREPPPGTESSASQPPPAPPTSTSPLAGTPPTAIQPSAETQPAASQPPPVQVDASHPQTTGPLEQIQQQEPSFYVRAACDHASGVYYEAETLGLRVQCEIDAYVYVVYRQADGKTYQIFPNSVQSDNHVKAGVETPIPASDDLFRWEVGAPYGKETVKVIASRKPLDSLADAGLRKSVFNPVSDEQVKELGRELSRQAPIQWVEQQLEIMTVARPQTPYEPKLRRFGVFFGVAEYQFNAEIKAAQGDGMNLNYPAEDAKLMASLFQKVGRMDDVRVNLNQNATRANLEHAITRWLPSVSKPGDTVFIYFSGHGAQSPDDNGDEADGVDEVLLPHDVMSPAALKTLLEKRQSGALDASLARRVSEMYKLYQSDFKRGPELMVRASAVSDDLFGRWLQYLDGRQIVVILDICFSGGFATQEKTLQSAAGGEGFDFLDRELTRLKDIGQRETALFAASGARELSHEGLQTRLGLMTSFLAGALGKAQAPLDLQQAYDWTSSGMNGYFASDEFRQLNDQRVAAGKERLPLQHAQLVNLCTQMPIFKP
ncbi:MAG TPA: DUF4384 domain-containing protein [Pirellulales bacterium]|nr:DUF4384 domain-containing protein [Pirellulales bacterium]